MDTFTLFSVAIGLAMDAFAVSVTNGILIPKLKFSHALTFGFFFGSFQFIMPIIGYIGGSTFKDYMYSFDHWIAFILLGIIGGKMFYESFDKNACEAGVRSTEDILSIKNMVILATATSIDAMAVGITLSAIGGNIIFSAAIIGIVAFILSTVGVILGKKIGCLFKTSAERFGGIILMFIGCKILFDHIF